MPRPLVALALTLALACGPSLARLERGHHYDEAICGASERAFPEDQLAKVIRRALDPALHVAVVPREQLAAVLGDAPELDHVALLAITRDSNTIPLYSVRTTLTLRSAAGSTELARADLERFAAVFEENVPGPRTVHPGALETGLHAAGTVGAVVLTVVSLGLLRGLLRGRSSGPKSRTVYPTEQQLRAAAPRAARLYDATIHLDSRGRERPGERCRTLALVASPPDESADLALAVELRYAAPCTHAGVDDRLEIPLPPGPTLEARLATIFGPDMRRLADLSPPDRPLRSP